ncbi:alpha-amylase family glycosyl hydrolase [Salinimonas sediminis]|uniref:1,4-alpha-glucan branching protein n=1 Tax=Salinimonas sediminis TaxID=2303538 RepID=A0A346NHS6_9ALTE|nr:alpha-amylase family glycosyl hydrolase [Salinimonas sediminis]AXR05083.1 1,4-alpha-glucan branching protein [Salinimonas sediminis]
MSSFNGMLGVTPMESGFQFAVWAPNASAVSLIGEFNNWDEQACPMESAEGGLWWCHSEAAQNGQEYKFAITTADGTVLQKNDPRARQLTNSVGNSIIYADDYQWQSDDFTPTEIHQAVIYELHIGTFGKVDEEVGTFDNAITRLDELAELGVNTIELMPVNEFAGDLSWGYNPAFPFAVEQAYGGPQALKRFIDAAHQRGLSVIMDVVYNHFGPSDLDIWQFDGWQENDKGGIYFYNDHRSATPWGDTRPDYGREEVRQYLLDNALMWVEEYRADGLRMDMVPYMRSVSGADDGSDDIPEAYSLIQQINGEIKARYPQKLTIAEDLHSHQFITNNVEDEGCGYSAQWDAAFVHPIRALLLTSNDDEINLDGLEAALHHHYSGRPFARVVYTESHDEVANGQARVVEEIAPGNVDADYFARNKGILGAAIVLTSCGIPMLFQGQEFKQHGYFTDGDDIDWRRREQFGEYLHAFNQLIRLRTNAEHQSAGLTGAFTEIVHKDQANKVLGFMRTNEVNDKPVWVYLNLSSVHLPEYALHGLPQNPRCLFAWQEGIATEGTQLDEGTLTLAPYSITILGNQ